jgi:hypothetical protein
MGEWQSVKNYVRGISLLVGRANHCVRIAEVFHYLGTQVVNMYIERLVFRKESKVSVYSHNSGG